MLVIVVDLLLLDVTWVLLIFYKFGGKFDW